MSYISKIQLTGGTYVIKDAAIRNIVNAVMFDDKTSFAVGDFVYYAADGEDVKLYRCKQAHSAGAWAAADFEEVTITSELKGIKDSIKGGIHYRGVTTSDIKDGDTTNPIKIDGKDYTAQPGDVVLKSVTRASGEVYVEYIWSGSKWSELGSTERLGFLAYKDSVSVTYDKASVSSSAAVVDSITGATGVITASAAAPAVTGATLAASHMKAEGGRTAALTGVSASNKKFKVTTADQTISLGTKQAVVVGLTGASSESFIYEVGSTSRSLVGEAPVITVNSATSTFATGVTSKQEQAFLTGVTYSTQKLVKASAYGCAATEETVKGVKSNTSVNASAISGTSAASFVNSVTVAASVATGITGSTASAAGALMASATVTDETLSFGFKELSFSNQTSSSSSALTGVAYTGVTASLIVDEDKTFARLGSSFSYADGTISAEGAGADIVNSVSVGATANAITGFALDTASAVIGATASSSYVQLRDAATGESSAVVVTAVGSSSKSAVVTAPTVLTENYGVSATEVSYAAAQATVAEDAAGFDVVAAVTGTTASFLQDAAFEAVAPLSGVSVAAPTITVHGGDNVLTGISYTKGVTAVTGLTYTGTSASVAYA